MFARLLAVIPLALLLPAQNTITSGVPQQVGFSGTYQCFASPISGCIVWNVTFEIEVSPAVTRMDVAVEQTSGTETLQTYVRLGASPTISNGSLVRDYTATPTAPVVLTRTGGLSTGRYFFRPSIRIFFFQGTVNVSGRLTVTLQTGHSSAPTRLITMDPCRLMETRAAYNFEGRTGTFGPPFLAAGESRTLTLTGSNVCRNIPATARAYVLNVTAVPKGPLSFVTISPFAESRPDFWTVRSPDGQTVANSAIVRAGFGGAINVYASDATDLIIDISGYFTEDTGPGTLSYYPLTPCRVIETRPEYRPNNGSFGPPFLAARETRTFRFPGNPYCVVPNGAAAYSITITVVPPAPLAYLTAWPAGRSQPNVSSMNSPAGRILANSVIVPASSDGSISLFTYDRSDVIVDINGYFAADDGQNGLFFYPARQCRLINTTFTNDTSRTIPVLSSSSCIDIASSAKAYALNATVIPNGSPVPFLTVWPTGQTRPNASVINAFQGQVVSSAFIVPAGTNGAVDVYAYRATDAVLEISGYFAR